jgi:hypothetical protein
VMRTLFGTLRLDSPRWWACPVNGHDKWQVLVDLSGRLWSIYLAAPGRVAL